jgi:hypothetical protein
MAQACLATLLRLDERADSAEGSPLIEYAVQHWVDHARFEKVSLRMRDGIDDLFDTTKPHFAAWLQVHDMDEYWDPFLIDSEHGGGSSLYYAALSGIYDLAERLIMKHPEQVNACGGRRLTPLVAALSKRHFHIAKLLRKEGASPNVRGRTGWTLLHLLSTLSGGCLTTAQTQMFGHLVVQAGHRCTGKFAWGTSSLSRRYLSTMQTSTCSVPKAGLHCARPCPTLAFIRWELTPCSYCWSMGPIRIYLTTTNQLRYIESRPLGGSRLLNFSSVTVREWMRMKRVGHHSNLLPRKDDKITKLLLGHGTYCT